MDSLISIKNDDYPSLCFNRDDFMSDTFNTDKFVSEHRKHASLETMRDDLSTYLKVLKSAMVELINHDYADFVNLSTNLAGLDKSINNLCVPLGQLKEEVMSVKSALDEALGRAHSLTKQQQGIRNRKLILQRVTLAIKGVEKLEKLYKVSGLSLNNTKSHQEQSDIVVERIANELIQIQFHLRKIPSLPIGEELKQRIEKINEALQQYLEDLFLESFKNNNAKQLQFVLRLCVTIGFVKNIQLLFKKRIVHPYMSDKICERNLKKDGGLKQIYIEVLQFLPLKCKKLLDITAAGANTPDTVEGYNFVVDIIWPDIVDCIETRIPIIFSPGSPDQFHLNYLASIEFVQKFEEFCSSPSMLSGLRRSPSYSAFLVKWNLPVYFQIRFPKVAGALEACLSLNLQPAEGSEYSLKSTEILFSCMRTCWSKEIFLPALSHRFLKLTLQLISRYCSWAHQVTDKETSGLEQAVVEPEKEANSNVIFNNVSTISNGPITPAAPTNSFKGPSLLQLVMLVKDILSLIVKVPLFFEETIYKSLKTQGYSDVSLIHESIMENVDILSKLLTRIGDVIISHLVVQCSSQLKSATDIPRLYRKTNREVPTKPSNYVGSLFHPVETLVEIHKSSLPEETLKNWNQEVIERVTSQYLTVTRDVLHQVKRVEDSLKILKKAREKTPTGGLSNTGALSDDDKIRLQLSIDIKHFGSKIETLGLKPLQVSSYTQLVELAESARSTPTSNS